MFVLDEPSGYCLLKVLRPVLGSLAKASLFHLALISGERYLAMKHPFTYTTMVTEARLLVASGLAWLLPIILQIPLAVDKRLFAGINNTIVVLSIAFMVFCHVTVYRETRRHEQQIAAQHVTQEAKEQFQKDEKAIKLTSTILAVLVVCFLPLAVFSIVALKYRSKITLETIYVFVSFGVSTVLLNSLFNPIIYTVRMRQFRVAFIELTCRTVNVTEAEEIETRVFGAPNAVVRSEVRQEHEGLDQQNVEEANGNNSNWQNSNVLLQHENCVLELPDDNPRLSS